MLFCTFNQFLILKATGQLLLYSSVTNTRGGIGLSINQMRRIINKSMGPVCSDLTSHISSNHKN